MSAKNRFGIPLNEVPELLDALNRLKEFPILRVWKIFYRYYRERLIERYDRAAKETPFAPSSIGRKKPKSGRIIPDGQFGVDGGDLYSDLTHDVKLSAGQLSVGSDLAYAGYILDLFAEKGPYAPESILFFDEEDQQELIDIIDQVLDRTFGINNADAN
jgi:hypothetical protein